MSVARKVIYSGRVQGVGFRFTAQRLAVNFPVAGYVRNMPTGEVELWAEGEAADVEAFVAAIAQRMSGYIDEQHVSEQEPQGLRGFRIRH